MDGILNINKDAGMTSHDVVASIRKLLKQKRVGHAGTLDPAAQGVLPICIGQGTRVAEYLSESGKAYQADITFGVVTDTYDVEGSIVRTTDVSMLTLRQIEAVLPLFLGPQLQQPPRYSAIKLQGQPAYKRVRAGEEIVLEPRPITIYQLQILAWQPPHLSLAIECSKGTYIRSLAYDLGERIGCGAYLSRLLRTRSGPFELANSITLAQLSSYIEQGNLMMCVAPTDSVLIHYPAIFLDEETSVHVLHGNMFRQDFASPQADGQLARIYDATGRFLAIGTWRAEQHMWQPTKVFATL